MKPAPLLSTRARRPDWVRDLLVIARPALLPQFLIPTIALALLLFGGFHYGFDTPSLLWTGWLGGWAGVFGGSFVREVQHTTMAWAIPRLRFRIATTYALGWMALTSLIGSLGMFAFCAWLESHDIDTVTAPWHAHFAAALAGVSIGTVLFDALSVARTCAAFALVIAATITSPRWGSFVTERPLLAGAIACGAVLYALRRVFSASWWRAMPTVPTASVASSFSHRSIERYQRERRSKRGVSSRRFSRAPLRERRFGWAGAAMVEGVSGRSWAMPAWSSVIVLLLALQGTWDVLGRVAAEELPSTAAIVYALAFGDDGVLDAGHVTPTWLLILWGLMMATRYRCDLRPGVPFPISREQRAHMVWAAQACLLAWSAFAPAAIFVATGLVAAAVGGVPIRDVVPDIVRSALVTAVLVVPAFWDTTRGGVATARRTGAWPSSAIALVLLMLGVAGLVVVERLDLASTVELPVLVGAAIVSWLAYRSWLVRHFARIDLVAN